MKRIYMTLLVAASTAGQAQYDAAVRLLDRIPQHALDLPASEHPSRLFVGIPGCSGWVLHAENGLLYPGQVLSNGATGTRINLDALRSTWKGTNRIGLDAQVELLSLGTRVRKLGFLTLSVKERVAVRTDVPSDLLLLPLQGTLGGVAWGDAALRLDHYRETAFGWQRTWGSRLRTGIRAKLLYGYEHADLQNVTGSWTTDPSTWAWTFQGGGDLRTSGSERWTSGSMGSGEAQRYFTGLNNRGLAFDFGAGTSFGSRTLIDVGLVDVGGIRWKDENRVFSVAPGEWAFAGLEMGTLDPATASDVLADTLEVWGDALLDAVENRLPIVETTESFRSALPARFTLSARHRAIERPRSRGTAVVTFMQESVEFGPGNRALTLGWSQEWGKMLAVAGTVGLLREGPPTAGAAVALNLGPVQIHVASDNLLALRTVDLRVDGLTIPAPAAAAVHHVRFGLNIVVGGTYAKDKKGSPVPPSGPPATTRRASESHLNPNPEPLRCALPGSKSGRKRR